MATPEYREITGKTGWQSIKELMLAKDAEDRRRTVQVLNMLKMKKKASQPKFSQVRFCSLCAPHPLCRNLAGESPLPRHWLRSETSKRLDGTLSCSGSTRRLPLLTLLQRQLAMTPFHTVNFKKNIDKRWCNCRREETCSWSRMGSNHEHEQRLLCGWQQGTRQGSEFFKPWL